MLHTCTMLVIASAWNRGYMLVYVYVTLFYCNSCHIVYPYINHKTIFSISSSLGT